MIVKKKKKCNHDDKPFFIKKLEPQYSEPKFEFD